jgi:hypothetical protein
MRDITNGKVTEKKRLDRVGATPLFDGEAAQKFRGVTPTLHGSLRSASGWSPKGRRQITKILREDFLARRPLSKYGGVHVDISRWPGEAVSYANAGKGLEAFPGAER